MKEIEIDAASVRRLIDSRKYKPQAFIIDAEWSRRRAFLARLHAMDAMSGARLPGPVSIVGPPTPEEIEEGRALAERCDEDAARTRRAER